MEEPENRLEIYHSNTLPMLSEGQALEIFKQSNHQTAVQIFEAKEQAIGLLAKANKEQIEAMIEFAIIDLMAFINVPRTMNEGQIRETARLVLLKFGALTIPDVKLVFDRIKCGQIKLFEGLDGHKILTAFQSWQEERDKAADEYSYNKHLTDTGHEKRLRDKPFLFGGVDSSLESKKMGEVFDEKFYEKHKPK